MGFWTVFWMISDDHDSDMQAHSRDRMMVINPCDLSVKKTIARNSCPWQIGYGLGRPPSQ